MTIEHFRNGFVVFHPPKTAKIAGSPRGRIRGQMRGWPSPEGHPAAQVDGIGHEGVQCMRASIVTASGAHQTTLRAHFSKKKKKNRPEKKKKKCPKVPEGGQNIMEMHFLMLFRGQNAQILLFWRKTAPQNAKIFSPDT